MTVDKIDMKLIYLWTWSVHYRACGSCFPSKDALNNTIDLFGCENGALCDAPLMVAKDNISPYTCVHPATCEKYV